MAKYRIEIDREACTGDGICVQEAPRTFEIGADDIVLVISQDGDSPEEIFSAAESCPTDAILLFDEETGEQVWPRR